MGVNEALATARTKAKAIVVAEAAIAKAAATLDAANPSRTSVTKMRKLQSECDAADAQWSAALRAFDNACEDLANEIRVEAQNDK
jgi:hypothetical protein